MVIQGQLITEYTIKKTVKPKTIILDKWSGKSEKGEWNQEY